jgi:D-3-phosphoglycerate dehydrogenase / 2-oxoglutarate reductase
MQPYIIFIERANFGITSPKVQEILNGLEEEGLAKIVYPNRRLNSEELGEEISRINPHIIIAATIKYTPEILSGAKNLIAVIRHGIGVDNVDFNYCKEKNIYLINTPKAPSQAVAYDVLEKISLMLSNSLEFNSLIKKGEWPVATRKDPRNITVGLIGAGRIPVAFAKITQNYGFKEIISYDILDEALEKISKFGVSTTKDINEILKKADVISMHAPLNQYTHHLINKEKFEILGDNKIFINTSRGPTVDTDALINWLRENDKSKAALDVLEQEPPSSNSELLQFPDWKLYLTSHLGASTDKGLSLMAEGAISAANAVIRGNGFIDPLLSQEMQTSEPEDMFNIVIDRRND